MSEETFNEWAVLELFGHQRIAGRVTSEQIGGASFVRVDVPDAANGINLTKFLNPTAIYSITPVDENVARAAALNCNAAPIQRYELQELARTRSLPGFDDEAGEQDDQ